MAESEAWIAGSEACLTGSEACLAGSEAWLAGSKACPAGSFALRWTNEWTDGWKISPFYKTPSPIRVAAKKEMKTTLAILSIFILFFSLTIDTTLINIANVYIAFLLVVTQLYKRVCLLVCGSIRWSILHACFSVCKKRAKLAKMRSVMTR